MRSNPYSQYVMRGADGLRWTVCTTTREAHGQIIEALQSDAFRGFRLEQFGAELTVTDKSAETLPLKDLTHRFYHEDSDRFFRLRFLTPTAFKSKERYVFFPNIRLIFRSLMSKYSVAAEDTDEVDEDMLSELTEKAAIVEYSLRSVRYSVEQTKIPSFMGELAIKVSGAQTLANYVRLLLCFGEYSGIGIKCSMGMGAVSLLDRRTGERRF
ncbi:MAG: CRISPR-associated endoribonuclease Cas6 [Clostridiales Family XIII bacterium]|nr:CRISPR-associated endoribonuclease Cas6 [Clostridiales Family XIII bacterium]